MSESYTNSSVLPNSPVRLPSEGEGSGRVLNSVQREALGGYSRFSLSKKFLRYYITASNGKGHGIHSPFVFDFIINVLNDAKAYPAYARVESLRKELKKDPLLLEIEDMGAGSALQATRHRTVANLARHAAKPQKLGQLLYRIAQYYKPRTILELGTSLGLSSAYLASGNGEAKLWTIEGAVPVARVAERNFRSLGLPNVELVTGNFDLMLDPVLEKAGTVDLAFVDGNHRLEPTLRYFHALMNRSSSPAILIFDDIHWSEEMEEAWNILKMDPRVYLTIDLFFIGLIFLREEFKIKQDFSIRF
ncbi:O-methyltransferase [Flavitalea flava]